MRARSGISAILLGGLVGAVLVALPAAYASPKNCNEPAGDYIVTFKGNSSVSEELRKSPGNSINPKAEFTAVLKGFAATLTSEQVCDFKKRGNIEFVEADGLVTASKARTEIISTSWGLDRIDQRDLPLDSTFTTSLDGAGVKAYVVDTGIYAKNAEFITNGISRVTPGFTTIQKSSDDCNGHGTHVAATIGGNTYGVAPAVTLVPVRVLNCQGSGTWSAVASGLDWIAKQSNPSKAVVNMSLGGGVSATLDAAVNRMITAGFTLVVAAGNSAADACQSSPGRVASAITVGATNQSDAMASFSNFGSCVDLFAPGVSIKSAWTGGLNATKVISGTSMASPHVAGVVAQYLSSTNPVTAPADIAAAIGLGASDGKVSGNLAGAPNLLLCLTTCAVK
jgi:subtilisin family serine protease